MGIARKRMCITAEWSDNQDEISLWKLLLYVAKSIQEPLIVIRMKKTSTVGCLESLFENSWIDQEYI